MWYVCFILLCLFTRASATCYYDGNGPHCFYLDTGAKNCNECSLDTASLYSLIPNSIPVQQYTGPCGCVLDINLDCFSLIAALNAPEYFGIGCTRTEQDVTGAIVNNQSCYNCPAPTPVPTPTLVPTPDAPTPTPAPTPAAPSNGGTSCIAQDQKVFEENRGEINVSDLEIGNRVMTYQGFQDFIGYIHNGSFQYTLKITIDTESTVELTKDHLVKVKNNYVHAKHVKIGDQFSSGKVTKITNGMSFVVSPLTRSGTIIVNNVVLSCYANVFSHHIANFVLAPLRVNIMKNVNKYFSALIAVYNVSPKWFKHMIAATDSYTF